MTESDRPIRKPYQAPVLVVYGDLRALTLQNGIHVTKDGGNNALGNRT